MIRIGVGGWTFEPWRQTFYPEDLRQKDELAHMASRLSAVEVNGTFYRTQTPATFRNWRDVTPEGFVFALKAPRYATNRKVLAEAGESIARFTDSGIAGLGPKLGPILWQFAAAKRFEADDFAAFLDLLPPEAHGLPLRHAVEVRHPSFTVPAFVALARERGVAIVLAGDSEYPAIPDAITDFARDFTRCEVAPAIREEAPGDAPGPLLEAAFGGTDESRILAALRRDGDLALSLVAEAAGTLLGHVALSPLRGDLPGALALGPLAVAPQAQRRGLGSALVRAALDRAGQATVVVLGDPGYYARFGFRPVAGWDSPYAGPYLMARGCDLPQHARIVHAPAFA